MMGSNTTPNFLILHCHHQTDSALWWAVIPPLSLHCQQETDHAFRWAVIPPLNIHCHHQTDPVFRWVVISSLDLPLIIDSSVKCFISWEMEVWGSHKVFVINHIFLRQGGPQWVWTLFHLLISWMPDHWAQLNWYEQSVAVGIEWIDIANQ